MEAIILLDSGLEWAILGHYWGIDEIGIYLIPALLAIVLLRRADRRARREADEETHSEAATSTHPESPREHDAGEWSQPVG